MKFDENILNRLFKTEIYTQYKIKSKVFGKVKVKKNLDTVDRF